MILIPNHFSFVDVDTGNHRHLLDPTTGMVICNSRLVGPRTSPDTTATMCRRCATLANLRGCSEWF